MNEYKFYALIVNGKITNLFASTAEPKSGEGFEVIQITPATFDELAYNGAAAACLGV